MTILLPVTEVYIYIYNVSECDDSIRYISPLDQIDTGKIIEV